MLHAHKSTLAAAKFGSLNETCLMVCSGSPVSIVHLELMKDKEMKSKENKDHFRICLLYIYDDVSANNNKSESLIEFQNFAKKACELNYLGYFVSIGEFFYERKVIMRTLKSLLNGGESDYNNLTINSKIKFKDASIITDMLAKIKFRLITFVAEILNCGAILFDDCSNDIAAMIVSNIALGQGPHISLHRNFIETRNRSIKLIYPLEKISQKEILNYCNENNKEQSFIDTLLNSKKRLTSIQEVTSSFVSNLDRESGNAVSSICRITNKLKTSALKGTKMCALCDKVIKSESGTRKMTAELAKQFSSLVSNSYVDAEIFIKIMNEHNEIDFTNSIQMNLFESSNNNTATQLNYHYLRGYMKNSLCYTCSIIFYELCDAEVEPVFLNELIHDNTLNTMKTDVRNLLIK